MKNAIVFLIFIAGLFIGCSEKEQVITFNEFDRLISADSIESLQVNDDGRALITKRSSSADKEKLVLQVPSAQDFFNRIETRYPNNGISNVSFVKKSSSLRSIELAPILLMLCMVVLFLYAAIDILKNQFVTVVEKLLWFQLVIIVPIIGPFLYLMIGKKQKVNNK